MCCTFLSLLFCFCVYVWVCVCVFLVSACNHIWNTHLCPLECSSNAVMISLVLATNSPSPWKFGKWKRDFPWDPRKKQHTFKLMFLLLLLVALFLCMRLKNQAFCPFVKLTKCSRLFGQFRCRWKICIIHCHCEWVVCVCFLRKSNGFQTKPHISTSWSNWIIHQYRNHKCSNF